MQQQPTESAVPATLLKREFAQPSDQMLPQEFLALLAELDRSKRS